LATPTELEVPKVEEIQESLLEKVDPTSAPKIIVEEEEKKKDFSVNETGIKVEVPFPIKSEHDKEVKVLFLGDTTSAEINYTADNSEMLGRMILAMNLKEGSFARINGDSGTDAFEEIAKLRPEVIVSLGAKATNLLLGRKEKLTSVHGKEFKNTLEFDSGEKIDFTVIPVFHPDYLEINPSMKRSAWGDLQKVLEFLKA